MLGIGCLKLRKEDDQEATLGKRSRSAITGIFFPPLIFGDAQISSTPMPAMFHFIRFQSRIRNTVRLWRCARSLDHEMVTMR